MVKIETVFCRYSLNQRATASVQGGSFYSDFNLRSSLLALAGTSHILPLRVTPKIRLSKLPYSRILSTFRLLP